MFVYVLCTYFSLFFLIILYYVCLKLEYFTCVFDFLLSDFYFKFDLISFIFSFVLFFVLSNIILFMVGYISQEKDFYFYFLFVLLLFYLAMLFLVWGPFMPFLIMGWDLLGLSSYLLILYYFSKTSSYSAMVTILINRVGDIFIIIGVVLCFTWSSYFGFKILSFLFLMAIISKRAQVPFRVWLPMAIMAPTPVSALVHSSTLVTAGVYLLIRYKWIFFVNFFCIKLLLFVSVLTLVISSLYNLYEIDLKKVIAFSTLRQMSFIIVGGFYVGVIYCFFHLVTHALFKSLLFIGVGNLIHEVSGGQHTKQFIFRSRIVLNNLCVFICLLCMVGFPFLAGFYSKDLFFEVFRGVVVGILIYILFFSRVVITCLYRSRLVKYIFVSNVVSNEIDFIRVLRLRLVLIVITGSGAVIILGTRLSVLWLSSRGWLELGLIYFGLIISVVYVFYNNINLLGDKKIMGLELMSITNSGSRMVLIGGWAGESIFNLGWNEYLLSYFYVLFMARVIYLLGILLSRAFLVLVVIIVII